MQDLIAFELAPGYEEFSGGNVSLVGGDMFDVGEALDESRGRIVLAPGARAGEDGKVSDAEALRAKRDEQVADALMKYPALQRVEPHEGDEPASFDAVDISVDSGSTLRELEARARELDIPGRSSMDKDELAEAIAGKEAELAAGADEQNQIVDGDRQIDGDDQEGGAGDGEALTEGSDD